MNKEIKQKWVDALRSGKYKQGKFTLRDADDKFCCLGVLCDIMNPDGWKLDNFNDFHHLDQCGPDDSSFPSKEFLNDLGIEHDYAMILADLNDGGNVFDYIADKIERDL